MENLNFESETVEEIYLFIKDIILTIEAKIFKHFTDLPDCSNNSNNNDKDNNYNGEDKEDNYNKSFEDLKSMSAMLMGTNMIEFYLNEVTKNLNKNDNELISNKFDGLSEKLNNTNKFLILNVIANVLSDFYPKFPRSKLEIPIQYSDNISENQEAYIKSVINILNLTEKYTKSNIIKFINDIHCSANNS